MIEPYKYAEVGRQFEAEVQDKLRNAGLGDYVSYANPVDSLKAYKANITKGVDIILIIHGEVYLIECSSNSYDYPYHQSWFNHSRTPRFYPYPARKEFHSIVCTNRPNNFRHIDSGTIQIVEPNTLIQLLKEKLCSPNSVTVPHIDVDSWILSSNPVIRLLQEARLLKKLSDSFKEHGLDLD